MTRLLLLAAAVGLVGILSVPLLLSGRYSDADRYKRELADWHVRWGEAGPPEERASLFNELERIQPPLASVTGASRHRQYVRAHQLVILADQAADEMVDRVRAALNGDVTPGGFSCESVAGYSNEAARIAQVSGVQLEWVVRACDIRATARQQLADVRSDALLDWLRDDIREVRSGAVSEQANE